LKSKPSSRLGGFCVSSTAFSNFKANLSSDFISNVLNLCYNKTALLKRDIPRFDIFLAILKNFMF